MASADPPATSKKGALFGKFALLGTKNVASDPSSKVDVPSPVIRNLHPLSPPAASSALMCMASSTSSGPRAQTQSTASTLAHSTAGAPSASASCGSSGSGIEGEHSPMPPFGSQRKAFFPITVLAASVQKKTFAMLRQGAYTGLSLSMFANARGDWRKRVITVSIWTVDTETVSPISGEEEQMSFAWLHIFKSDAPSCKEVGRVQIGFNSVVGLLDPDARGGQEAEGKKNVLTFTAGKKAKKAGAKRVKEVFGEAEEKLIMQFESEDILQSWIFEIKSFIFIKRAEGRGIGNAARAVKERGEALSGDIDILLDNLAAAEAKKHADRLSFAASVASTDTTASAAPSSRIVVPLTVVENRESGEYANVEREVPLNSAQAAAQATESLEQMIANAQLPSSLTSSSLGSGQAADVSHGGRAGSVMSRSTTGGNNDAQSVLSFEAHLRPLPKFGGLRFPMAPITVLSVEVEMKPSAPVASGYSSREMGGLSLFGKGKAPDWKNRFLVLTSYNIVPIGASASDVRKTTTSTLCLFKDSGPCAKEKARIKLDAATTIDHLEAGTTDGWEAEGRRFVLRIKIGEPSARTIVGDIYEEKLLVNMPDEETLNAWIAVLRRIVSALGTETSKLAGSSFNGSVNDARNMHGGTNFDLDAAASSSNQPSTGAPVLESNGVRHSRELARLSDGVGNRSEVSDHSSYQQTFGTRSILTSSSNPPQLESLPMSRNGSDGSPGYITRPVLVGATNSDVGHLLDRPDALPTPAHYEDFNGTPQPIAATLRPLAAAPAPVSQAPPPSAASVIGYRASEMMLHSPASSSHRNNTAGDSQRTFATASSAPEQIDPHQAEIERLKRVEAELRSQLEIERLRSVEAELRGQLKQQRKRRAEDERRRQQIESITRDSARSRDQRGVGPTYSGAGSDDSDVDPMGPIPRGKRIHSSATSSTHSGHSASDSSSYQGFERSVWDAATSRQDRQSSTTTVGSAYSDRDAQYRSSPLSPPVVTLSRRASSKLSSGPSTPIDEEDGYSFARPRSSSRSSYGGARPAGLGVEHGSSLTLASPNRLAKSSLGPPAPPPTSLPPPPPLVALDSGGARQHPYRPSAALETLSERSTRTGRSRAAMLRGASMPSGPRPPSGALPSTLSS